ncbi:hypothetical protein NX059_010066 [Plenodomus lindquistii]|nr:hypothetical protein NX059_010066 [Plenodomus lindquistii]
MLAYTIGMGMTGFFITLFQCTPVSAYWEMFKYTDTKKCLNIRAIYYFHAIQNTVSDFVIFLWPAKDLLNVKISLRQRVTLTCMFSLGVVVCIAGSLRIYYTSVYLGSYDAFWHGATTFIVMSVESNFGVICGCLPGCKPLMNRLFPRIFASSSTSSYPRPSAQERVRELQSSQGAREHDAYPLKSLAEDETGFVMPVQWKKEGGGRVLSGEQVRRAYLGSGKGESVRGLKELDSASDVSEEMGVGQSGKVHWQT